MRIELGSSTGTFYVSQPDGTFITTDPMFNINWGPLFVGNTVDAIPRLQWLFDNMDPGTATYATARWEVTTAVVGTYTSIQINTVNIAAVPLTITTTDPTTTAAEIAAAINLHTPTSGINYSATSVGPYVNITALVAGNSVNGHLLNFSGVGQVGTAMDVAGGRDSGEYRFRVYYDPGTDRSTRPVGAYDVSDTFVRRDFSHAAAEVSQTIDSNGEIQISRIGNQFTVLVTGDPSNPGLSTINYPDAQIGDRITIKPAAVNVPFNLQNNSINVIGRDMQFEGLEDTIELRVTQQNPLILEQVTRTPGVFDIRSDEVEVVTTPVSGTLNVRPNKTGAAGAGETFRNNVSLNGTRTLAGTYSVVVDTTNLRNGDSGVIDGTGSAITSTATNALQYGDGTTTYTIPISVALDGNWKVNWKYDGTKLNMTLAVSQANGQNTAITDVYFPHVLTMNNATQTNGIQYFGPLPYSWEILSSNTQIDDDIGATDDLVFAVVDNAGVVITGLSRTFATGSVASATTKTDTPAASTIFAANQRYGLSWNKATQNGGRIAISIIGRKV